MATIRFGIPGVPYSQVEFDPEEMSAAQAIAGAVQFYNDFSAAFASTASDETPRQGAQRVPQGNGQRETRADKYPVVPGMQCDQCGGPVGRYPKTGRMTSDKGVCLGRCKDGQYVHTVGWLNDEPDAEPF